MSANHGHTQHIHLGYQATKVVPITHFCAMLGSCCHASLRMRKADIACRMSAPPTPSVK